MIGTLAQNISLESQVSARNEQKGLFRSSILAYFHCFSRNTRMNYFQLVEYQLIVQEYIHIENFLIHTTAKKRPNFNKFPQNQQKSAKNY